jgi:uncharacterized protein (TIGR02246 family)
MKKSFVPLVAMAVLTIITVRFIAADDQPANKPTESASDRKADEQAIRQTMQNFTAAFEKGDAAAAAAFLAAGAELIPAEAPLVRGREEIQKAFAEHFAKNPRVKITLEPEPIRFTSRDTAIEEGQMRVASEKGDPAHNRYSVLCVREDGKWLLAFIKEWPSEQTELKDLDWLIGTWSAKRPDAEIQTTFEWFGNKAFIRGQFTVRQKDKTLTGMQMIGTDPETGELRTWTFETDGGFGEGTCTRDGNKWVFDMTTSLSDGTVLEARNVLLEVNNDTFTWQPVNLTLDGEQLGELPPVKVTRVKAKD